MCSSARRTSPDYAGKLEERSSDSGDLFVFLVAPCIAARLPFNSRDQRGAVLTRESIHLAREFFTAFLTFVVSRASLRRFE